MATRKPGKSESAEAQVPPRSSGDGQAQPPKQGRGAAAKRQPRVESAAGATTSEKAPRARSTGGTTGEKSGGGTGAAGTAGRRTRASTGPDLQRDLHDFAAARPHGWNHDEWINFLQDLESRGHNVSDRDQIGLMLERERLGVLLSGVQGVGPQRIRALAERYGTVWNLSQTDPEQLARDANLPPALAERVLEAVRH